MSGEEDTRTRRVREILTSLLEYRLGESLGDVENALAAWRRGSAGVFEAHAELLKHAARAEQLIEQLIQEGDDSSLSALRDAFDADLLGRAEFIELAGKAPEDVEPSPPLSDAGLILPEKRDVVEELLDDGPVLVQVDARRDGVMVPDRFREDPRLVLRFGYGLTPPISDLELGDESLSATLTFTGVPHHCVLPWSAVYAVVAVSDQRRMVWPDDVPQEALATEADAAKIGTVESAPAPQVVEKPKRGGHLKLVK